MKLISRWLFVLAALLLANLSAQPAGSGTLSGRVTDATTGLALGGARVSVDGTSLEAFTNTSGD